MAMGLMIHSECGVFDNETYTVMIMLLVQVDIASEARRFERTSIFAEHAVNASVSIMVVLLLTCTRCMVGLRLHRKKVGGRGE